MPNTSLMTYGRLFDVIFPNEQFSASKLSQLASALKTISEDIGKRCQPKQSTLDGSKKKLEREFDFSRYQKRYIALNLAYQGFDYYGFARQQDIKRTIEEELFSAIRKTRLVPEGKSWKEMIYSRGGRTDKGVSAAGQVVALEVRSRALVGEAPLSEELELDYPGIINKVLSPNIRILGWKTVDSSFSARFSATGRDYKYFFVDQDCKLDLPAMQEAASLLIGEHDFRNFCKADVPTVTNFVRSISSATLKRAPILEAGRFSIIELHISGTAFLWHQIRCIAAVLFMIGKGQEKSSVIKELLDVTKVNQKPQYTMASEQSLLLYKCSYSGLEFNKSTNVLESVKNEVTSEISRLLSKAFLLLSLRDSIEMPLAPDSHFDLKPSKKNHVHLLERPREPSIEQRLSRKLKQTED